MDPSPDNLRRLLGLVDQCLDGRPEVRKPAEAKIVQVQTTPGFTTCLMALVMKTELKMEQRQFSGILLKNTVSKFWQPRGSKSLHDKDKQNLKNALLSPGLFSEPNDLVHRQITATAAKVARFDWPRKWESLFPTMIKAIQTGSELQKGRALDQMLQILRELVSRRLFTFRKTFQAASMPILNFIQPQWMKTTQAMLEALKTQRKEAGVLAKKALQLLRCLKELVCYGIAKLDNSSNAAALFPAFLEVSNVLLKGSREMPESNLKSDIRGMVLVIGSTLIHCQKQQPFEFIKYMGPFVKFFSGSLLKPFDPKGELLFEKQTIQAITFLSSILSCPQYTSLSGKSAVVYSVSSGISVDGEGSRRAQSMLSSVFTNQFVATLAKITVFQLLPLKPSDLDEWKADGESFVMEMEHDRYDHNIRAAAENLFTQIARVFPQVGAQILMQALQKCMNGAPLANNQGRNVLLKHALYFALGIGYHSLNEVMEKANCRFEQWFKGVMARDLSDSKGQDPSGIQCVVRARAIWCLGEWVDSIKKPELRNPAYSFITVALKDRDMVVRLMAVKALISLVIDFHFKDTAKLYIQRHMAEHCELLLRLTSEVRELEARKLVSNALRSIVEQLKDGIKPVAGMLLKYLPEMWKRCGEHDMQRPILLSILKELTLALKQDATKIHEFIVEVLRYSMDPKRDRYYLTEYAMELWHSLLYTAPSLTVPIVKLFPYWTHQIKNNLEQLETSLPVLEAYILLSNKKFLEMYGKLLSTTICEVFAQVKDFGRELIVQHTEYLAQRFPQQFTAAMEPLVCTILSTLLHACKVEEQKKGNVANDKTLRIFSRLLTRLLVQDFSGVTKLMQKMSNGKGIEVLGMIMGLWLDRLGESWALYKRRVAVLGMCKCMVVNDNRMLGHLEAFLAFAGSVVAEESEERTRKYIEELETKVRSVREANRTHKERLMILILEDPTTKVDVRGPVSHVISELRKRLGPRFDEKLRSVDEYILQPFLRK